MKKLFIIAALAILADVAMAQTQEKVLYILNGEVASKATVDSLPSGSIRDMNVIKGIGQVVLVNTKDYSKKTVIVKSVKGRKKGNEDRAEANLAMQDIFNNKNVKSVTVRPSTGEASPLYVVKSPDGKIESVKEMKQIDPQTIKAVTVMKNEEAKKGFGKFGDTSGGVVLIELK